MSDLVKRTSSPSPNEAKGLAPVKRAQFVERSNPSSQKGQQNALIGAID
jgi:hypothetical protein